MAATLLLITQIYAALGAATALAFLVVGLGRVEPNARGVWVFRLFLIPGLVLIWPLVCARWIALERGGTDPQAAHRPPFTAQTLGATLLCAAIPVMIFAALIVRQDGPSEAPAILLEPPQ